MTKAEWGKLWQNKKVRYILLGIGALFLLLAIWLVFFEGEDGQARGFESTGEELRIACLLEKVHGVEDATVYISQIDGEKQSVVVFFRGKDSILTRSKIIDVVSATLNVKKQQVQVYPAKK